MDLVFSVEVLVNRLNAVLLAAAALCVAQPASAQTAAQISETERAALVQHLTTIRDQVIAESAKLTDAQWTFKAAPDRWSVAEVVQHLVLAEPFLFATQQKLLSAPPATAEQLAATKGKEEMIRKVIPDRTKKVQAPEPLQPTTATKVGGQAETIAAFQRPSHEDDRLRHDDEGRSPRAHRRVAVGSARRLSVAGLHRRTQ